MKTGIINGLLAVMLITAACTNQVNEQVTTTVETGKELEGPQSQLADIYSSDFADFIFNPSEHTFEEVDAYYRQHLSMQAGNALQHNDHSIALQVLFDSYDLLSQQPKDLAYYWEEMNRLDWVISSLLPLYKQTAEKMEPVLGQAAVRETMAKRYAQNQEEVTRRFTEHSPEMIPSYLQANNELAQ